MILKISVQSRDKYEIPSLENLKKAGEEHNVAQGVQFWLPPVAKERKKLQTQR